MTHTHIYIHVTFSPFSSGWLVHPVPEAPGKDSPLKTG